MCMKRREILRKAGIGGSVALGSVVGSSANVAASMDCKWNDTFTCLSYTSGYDADVIIQDYDTSDDYRAGAWTAIAQVDESVLKRERVAVTVYVERCNASNCGWTDLGTAVADTGDFDNHTERDESQASKNWDVRGSTWESNYRYKVQVYNYVEWNPDHDYDSDPASKTCTFGPFRVCPL